MLSEMTIVRDYRDITKTSIARGSVITIGNFDGVHQGHQTIISHCRRQANLKQLTCIICTFEPHPGELFAPGKGPARISTPERKQQLLLQTQPDVLLWQTFDHAFAGMLAEQFVQDALVNAMNAKIVVVGKNFRFGKNRAGDIELLRQMSASHDFEVVAEDLLTTPDEIISSTRIRRLLKDGHVAESANLLSRYHELPGTVVRGEQVGQTLGFPTINVSPEKVVVPNDGIYSAFVSIEGKSRRPAAVYIGDRPTLQHGHSIEAHLLDFKENIYGRNVTIYFVSKIRDNQKFDSIDQLRAQIAADVTQIRAELEKLDE